MSSKSKGKGSRFGGVTSRGIKNSRIDGALTRLDCPSHEPLKMNIFSHGHVSDVEQQEKNIKKQNVESGGTEMDPDDTYDTGSKFSLNKIIERH